MDSPRTVRVTVHGRGYINLTSTQKNMLTFRKCSKYKGFRKQMALKMSHGLSAGLSADIFRTQIRDSVRERKTEENRCRFQRMNSFLIIIGDFLYMCPRTVRWTVHRTVRWTVTDHNHNHIYIYIYYMVKSQGQRGSKRRVKQGQIFVPSGNVTPISNLNPLPR